MHDITPGVFSLPRLERVIAGPGTLDRLSSELDRYGCRRAVVVTGATLGASPLVARVRALLGDRAVAVFSGARQHVPATTVHTLRALVADARADALVSVGGGSPIDTAKGVVYAILNDVPPADLPEGRRGGRRAIDAPVHIAVPTTLSAGEFTDVAGITDEGTRIKHALYDTRLAPRTVIADPVVARETPDWLWAASGMRALDHAIETLYAPRRHPLSDALAERAIVMLVEHLPASLKGGDDVLPHRGACQLAAWLAVYGVTNAGFGLSHALGHQIGPRWNVAHGATSSIVLPHAMRFMAAMAADRFVPIARALGVPVARQDARAAALACADRVAELVAVLGLPRRLRDVAVPEQELPQVAAAVAGVMQKAAAVDRAVTGHDLRDVLAAAY